MKIKFDRYYKYDELTKIVHEWAAAYPTLCQLDVLGKSYEERDIWVLTITNQATGAHDEKPAYWVDGNIHATELSASTAALYLANMLLTQYGEDERVTYTLDTRTFYIVPRLNPDGAEWALADVPRFIRSSTKPYPRQDQLDGLHQSDVDGDGRILQMRVRDPNGNWKPHADIPQMLVPREPDDLPGGEYYRLLPEGEIQNFDGVTIKRAPSLQGLDLNRNFPVFWTPKQTSGGTYAGSEPEPRATIDWVTSHKNITGGTSFHTFSGVHLRPPTKGADSELPTGDLRTYKKLGDKAMEMTGYPAISVFHEFAYDPKTQIKGTFDDWLYEYVGVYAWTTEIWSVQKQAGIEDYKFIEWWGYHPREDDVKIFRWFEETVSADFYVDWYEFDHPQLGKVELGGWDILHTWRNPPLELLEKEVAPLADFCLFSCLISPKLELHSTDVQSDGEIHRIRLVVQNTGYLPTNVTEQAQVMNVVNPLEVDITIPEGTKLLLGEKKTFGGQLAGRDQKLQFAILSSDVTDNLAKFEWVVQAAAGTEFEITAKHDRAGTVRTTVTV